MIGVAAAVVLGVALAMVGASQRRGASLPVFGLALAAIALVGAVALAPDPVASRTAKIAGAEAWSEGAVRSALAEGKPAFVYFTADWCLTCKVN